MCVCLHVQANTFPPLNRQRPKCVGCKPWDSEPQTHVYQPWATIQGRAQGKPQLKSLRAMQTEKTFVEFVWSKGFSIHIITHRSLFSPKQFLQCSNTTVCCELTETARRHCFTSEGSPRPWSVRIALRICSTLTHSFPSPKQYSRSITAANQLSTSFPYFLP